MSQQRVRIVIGEGQSARKGLLRFVLEGEGHEVVAEATGAADLARALAVHKPDVAVLDDGIGATAAQMVRDISPGTKVVLVWPGAVVPIGGDARVEPSEVLRSLGPAVTKVSGHPGSTMETIQRPEWIDRVRKDPSTLREMLERRGASIPKRPSVTELQKRGQRLHPVTSGDDAKTSDKPTPEKDAPGVAASSDADVKEKAAEDKPAKAGAPLVILPTPSAEGDAGEPIVVLPSDEPTKTAEPEKAAASADAGVPDDSDTGEDEKKGRRRAAVIPIAAGAAAAATRAAPAAAAISEWNQKLGTIALGGAAVAGALVLALALGGARVHTQIGAEAPTRPPSVGPSVPGPGANNGPDNGPDNGPNNAPNNGPDKSGGNGPDKSGNGPNNGPDNGGPSVGGGTDTGSGTNTGGGGDHTGGGGDNNGGGGGDNNGGGGGDNNGGGGGDNNGGGGGGDGGGGDGGGGDGGGGGETPRTYGASAEHNPHGGPPGHADCDGSIESPGNSGNAPGQTGQAPPAHSHAGGNGNGNAYGLEKPTHAHKC